MHSDSNFKMISIVLYEFIIYLNTVQNGFIIEESDHDTKQ